MQKFVVVDQAGTWFDMRDTFAEAKASTDHRTHVELWVYSEDKDGCHHIQSKHRLTECCRCSKPFIPLDAGRARCTDCIRQDNADSNLQRMAFGGQYR